jgi:ABC-type sugar transport system substrate-binding protein
MKMLFLMLILLTAITVSGGCAPTDTPEPETVVVTEVVTQLVEPEVVVVTATPSADEIISEEPEEDEPEVYRPVLKPATKAWRIGYTDGGAQFDVSVIRWKGIQEAAEIAGVEMVYCDNAYPDIEKHISCAELMINQEVDLVISSSWMSEINQQLMDMYNEAGIPVIGWDVTHPGSRSYYGIDTWTAGVLAGDYAGKWALENCNYDADIVLMDNPEVGEFPRQKLWGFEAGVRLWLPGTPPERKYTISGGSLTEDATDALGAWLDAHPDSTCVLVTMINNYSAVGAAAAFDIAGRSGDGCIVGQGADAPMFSEFVIPEDESAFKASVSDSPWKDGEALIPMAVDILEGVDVPPIVLKEHEVIDRDNIDEMVPEEYQMWP